MSAGRASTRAPRIARARQLPRRRDGCARRPLPRACAAVPRRAGPSRTRSPGRRPCRCCCCRATTIRRIRRQPRRLAAVLPQRPSDRVPGLAHGVIAYGCLRLVRRVSSRRAAPAGWTRAARPRSAAALRAQLAEGGARGARRPWPRRAPCGDSERGDCAQDAHRWADEEGSADAVDDAGCRAVGAGAIEDQDGDGDAEHASPAGGTCCSCRRPCRGARAVPIRARRRRRSGARTRFRGRSRRAGRRARRSSRRRPWRRPRRGCPRKAGAGPPTISGRLPMRPPSAPVKGETASGRRVQGSVSTPARRAESPCTCVRYWMIRKKAANIVKCSPNPAPLAAAKPGRRKRPSGSIGAAERRSCSTNAPSSSGAGCVGERASRATSSRRRCRASWPTRSRAGRAGEREAREVERHLGSAALRQAAGRQHGCRQADGHVDPEDPVPVQRLDDQPAEQRPERHAKAGDRRPQSERGRASLRREGGREQRQRERHEQRGAQSLDGACDDELGEVVGEGAGGRGGREHEQSHDEHAPAAIAIAERGAGEDEDGEDEDVGVDDPLQAIDGDSEVALHRREGREHDQVVQGDHEERGAGEGDCPDVSGSGGQRRLPSCTMTLVLRFDDHRTCCTTSCQTTFGGETWTRWRTRARRQLDLSAVLHALSDPVRRSIVAAARPRGRGALRRVRPERLQVDVDPSFPRPARGGVIEQVEQGNRKLNTLRRDELEQRFPGLLEAVLGE